MRETKKKTRSIKEKVMQVTIQTKIRDPKSEKTLEKMCEKIGEMRSRLLCDIVRGREANELKREYIREHGLIARQYNSLSSEVRGLLKANKKARARAISEIESRIKSQQKNLKKLGKILGKILKNRSKGNKGNKGEITSLRWRIHQKKRKLEQTRRRLENLKKKKISICLGGRKLFLAQYNLEKNGYESHGEWQKKWHEKRSNRIFFIGSKGESLGNQNCQLIGNHLQVRMLPSLQEEQGKYIEIPVEFSYGQEIILEALKNDQAINYRFVHKEKGWYLFLTTKRVVAKQQTKRSLGAIGVDLNKAHLAWAETNRHGNLVKHGKIGIAVQDRSSNQVTASLGEAVKKIVEYAKEQQKPIVVEKLDFQRKKTKLAEESKSYRRMLSYFAYSKFMSIMYSKAFREGVEIISVNPAYSSIIGKYKFARMYGISTHVAASLVLARRGLRLRESLPTRTARYLAVHRYWHVWKKWARLFAVSNREKQVGLVPQLLPSRKILPLGDSFLTEGVLYL